MVVKRRQVTPFTCCSSMLLMTPALPELEFAAVIDKAGAEAASRIQWLIDTPTRLRQYADLAAAAQLSCVDFLGDAPWHEEEPAKLWYQRLKSRPSFRPLLAERMEVIGPAPHYANVDF